MALLDAACRKTPTTLSDRMDEQGCIVDPPPPDVAGPFPFENCRVELTEQRPLPTLDQEVTAVRRKVDARACCYSVHGNR